MCVSRRVIYIVGIVFIFYMLFQLISIVEEKHIIYLIISIMMFFISGILLGWLTRCPKCGTWITFIPNEYWGIINGLLPFYNRYCKKCGQDLNKCVVESHETTDK